MVDRRSMANALSVFMLIPIMLLVIRVTTWHWELTLAAWLVGFAALVVYGKRYVGRRDHYRGWWMAAAWPLIYAALLSNWAERKMAGAQDQV